MWLDNVPDITMSDAIQLEFWKIPRTRAGVESLSAQELQYLIADKSLLLSLVA